MKNDENKRAFWQNFAQALTAAHKGVSAEYPFMHIRTYGYERLELEFRKEVDGDVKRIILTFDNL